MFLCVDVVGKTGRAESCQLRFPFQKAKGGVVSFLSRCRSQDDGKRDKTASRDTPSVFFFLSPSHLEAFDVWMSSFLDIIRIDIQTLEG